MLFFTKKISEMRDVHKIEWKTERESEWGKQQTANFYDMPVIVKAHKTCKISFNFLSTRMVINFSSQFTSHLSSSGCSAQNLERERGAINIYDDYWQHRKSLSVCFILCPFRRHKKFHEINQHNFFTWRRFLTREFLFYCVTKKWEDIAP